MSRRTKIVATLGPATDEPGVLEALIEAGVDVVRLNFSHGTHEDHAKVASLVREAASRMRKPVAILGDLCGPKMRVGKFPNGPIELEEGARFTLTSRKVPGDQNQVSHSSPPLSNDVVPGDAILLDDGLLRLRVIETSETEVVTEVEVGGTLSDRKGMNVPGANLSTPALTEKDRTDLAFAVDELKVDYLALSFVRTEDDVAQAQMLAKGTPVIAKLEKPEAIEHLGAILDRAEGAMVARGDLGVEVGSEKVPLIQKRIIREVNERGKIVITATQMLDSMIRNPRPTRAEAADVANAVIDGTDAAARAAAMLSYALPLKAIVAFTRDGRTARLMSEYRPRAPIVAITANPQVANRMALEWGVTPRLEIPPDTLEEALRLASALLVREKFCVHGDSVAMTIGWPPSVGTNTVKLHTL